MWLGYFQPASKSGAGSDWVVARDKVGGTASAFNGKALLFRIEYLIWGRGDLSYDLGSRGGGIGSL